MGPCPPNCYHKDIIQATGFSFGGILRAKSKEDFCRLKITLDVRDPLRRSIFIKLDNDFKVWLPFKYEKLPSFYFGCGRMSHSLQGCAMVEKSVQELP